MDLITENEFRRIVKKFRPDLDASMDYEHAEQSMAELGVTPEQFRALRLKNARLDYHVAVVVCVLVLLVMIVLNIYNAHLVAVGWNTKSPSEFHTATLILIITIMMDFACGSASLIALKSALLRHEQIQRWNGQFPRISTGSNSSMLLNVPDVQ